MLRCKDPQRVRVLTTAVSLPLWRVCSAVLVLPGVNVVVVAESVPEPEAEEGTRAARGVDAVSTKRRRRRGSGGGCGVDEHGETGLSRSSCLARRTSGSQSCRRAGSRGWVTCC